MEYQNIVTELAGDNIWVSRYPGWISVNIKGYPIEARYYIFSKKKLTADECIEAIAKYEELNVKIP